MRVRFVTPIDNNGNTLTSVTGSNTTTYAWDFENRLTSVTLPGSGGTVSFKYDPFGRRIYKSSSSATSVFAYDGINLIEETNAAGGVVARYSEGLNLDEPLAMLRSSTTSYYQTDGLNSVTSLSNAAGSIANTYTYDSFGKLTASTGSLTNSFRYTGREFDAETSLYYMRARYFDPSTGRFLNEDPIGFSGGSDFYSYVDGDSTSLVDLLGLGGTGTATAPAPVTTPTQPVRPTPPVPSDPGIAPKPPTSGVGRTLGNLLDDALGVLGDPSLDYRPDPSSGPPCNKRGCKPCIPPVGTRAYRADTDPNSPAHRGGSNAALAYVRDAAES
jgi:RHS repeat-associated protein